MKMETSLKCPFHFELLHATNGKYYAVIKTKTVRSTEVWKYQQGCENQLEQWWLNYKQTYKHLFFDPVYGLLSNHVMIKFWKIKKNIYEE